MKNIRDYVCPNCRKNLKIFKKKNNCYFAILKNNIPCFTKRKTSKVTNYEISQANKFYNNYLDWLFKTFKTSEKKFRKKLFQNIKFKYNQKILITSVGNGGDLNFVLNNFKKLNLKIYAQDLSAVMLQNCFKKYNQKNIFYFISDAKLLPFKDNSFDHVFHFGGINLFGNYEKSINEMERVVKTGGSITYGDEGIGVWLKNTIYSNMLIKNNKLWKFKLNLKHISLNAKDVKIQYLLGNCFYLINYIYEPNYQKKFNYKITHKSPRGGSILSRYINKTKLNESYIKRNLNKII